MDFHSNYTSRPEKAQSISVTEQCINGMAAQMEIRTLAFYKFLFRPSLNLCRVGDQILLSGTDGNISIPFQNLQQIQIVKGFIFHSLIFSLKNNNQTFALRGLSQAAARKGQSLVLRNLAEKTRTFQSEIDEKWPRIAAAHAAWRFLVNHQHYITHSMYEDWLNNFQNLELFKYQSDNIKGLIDKERAETILETQNAIARGQVIIDAQNIEYVKNEMAFYEPFFDKIDKYPLTKNQRLAVIYDEDCNLVVAGAGTGKTSTIMAKVGYLMAKNLASPEDMLLLAFTDKAAKSMQKRIEAKFNKKLNVRTFHGLGLDIISESTGMKPSTCHEARDNHRMLSTLKRHIEDLMKDDGFRAAYIDFQVYYRVPYRPAWHFKTLSDYKNYLRSNNIRALQGEKVRSFEECAIANWLYMNGIRYEYEAMYEINVASREYSQYRPDFYLPDSGIYIEHFAVDRAGQTPPFICQERYTAQMTWKRGLHKTHQTRLIETYSWQQKEGILLEELDRQLRKEGIVPAPIPESDVLKQINMLEQIDPFVNLLATFYGLLKSSGNSLSTLSSAQSGQPKRVIAFMRILAPIAELYESRNRQKKEIDFNDMIALAINYVAKGHYRSAFKYILVDEFQDIASGRAKLLLALRDQVPGCRLFCVGDDWQSIYRFTGSCISLMTNFPQNFGYTKRTDLDRTFRFNNKIEQLSTNFILKNTSQLNKKLKPNIQALEPSVFLYLSPQEQNVIEDILKDIDQNGGRDKETVFVLTRYNFQIPAKDVKTALIAKYPRLHISFMTAHSSKGLETDYVILDKLNSGRYGFPTEVTDDPLLNLVLPKPDEYENGEERRLFYVAITRARKKVYLVADPTSASSFVRELMQDKHYDVNIRGVVGESPPNCPACGSGLLVPHTNKTTNVLFYKCSNSPLCTYKEDACPKCQRGPFIFVDNNMLACVTCGHKALVCKCCGKGRMVIKNGKFGKFWSCTMFSSEMMRCTYTESI